jgi:hypothetical protein
MVQAVQQQFYTPSALKLKKIFWLSTIAPLPRHPNLAAPRELPSPLAAPACFIRAQLCASVSPGLVGQPCAPTPVCFNDAT